MPRRHQAPAAIATIKAGGGTSILPPLQAAFEAAAASDAPLKHIVLLTDGESNDRGYEDLLARMSAPDHPVDAGHRFGRRHTPARHLAHLGGGRYYFTERSTQIPRIASKETTILTRNAVVEGQVAPVVAEPSPILRSISGDLPPLSGYVATTRKDRAVTALETERGHPLLAHWQYGLGRVVAWTSDAQQGWASAWAEWPDAAQFWSQAVRWSLPAPVRPTSSRRCRSHPTAARSRSRSRRWPTTGASPTCRTRARPSCRRTARRASWCCRSAAGCTRCRRRSAQRVSIGVLFTQGQREEVAAFSAPDSIERHSVGTNAALLDQLATSSGGHALRTPTDLAAGNGPGPKLELWPWLLLAAVLLLPLDVYLRRRT